MGEEAHELMSPGFMQVQRACIARTDVFDSGILGITQDTKVSMPDPYTIKFGKGTFAGHPCSDILQGNDRADFTIDSVGRGSIDKGPYDDCMRILVEADAPFSEGCAKVLDMAALFLDNKGLRYITNHKTHAGIDYFIAESIEGMTVIETGEAFQKDLVAMLEKRYIAAAEERRDGYMHISTNGVNIDIEDISRSNHDVYVSFSAERGCDRKFFDTIKEEVRAFAEREYGDLTKANATKARTGFTIDVMYKAVETISASPHEMAMFNYVSGQLPKLKYLGIANVDDLKRKIIQEGIAQIKRESLNPIVKRHLDKTPSGNPAGEVIDEIVGAIRGDKKSATAAKYFGLPPDSSLVSYSGPSGDDDDFDLSKLKFVFSSVEITLHGREINEVEDIMNDPQRQYPERERSKKMVFRYGLISLFDLLCQPEANSLFSN